MKTFIALTDFSKNAKHASEYAVQLAQQTNNRILLCHIFEEPIAVSEYELTTVHFHNMESRILKQLEERKQELIEKFGTSVPIECVTYNRNLIENIKKIYNDEKEQVRLAVIGLTGSGMTNFFLGSNTLNIVNNTGRTILTVPPFSTFRPIQNILFACDMQDVTATVPARRIKRILEVLQAKLHILNVQKDAFSPSQLETEEQALAKLFEDIPYEYHSVSKQNTAAEIKDYAKKCNADMIAIIPRKYDFWESLIVKNHTKAMLFRSDMPILTIPKEEDHW